MICLLKGPEEGRDGGDGMAGRPVADEEMPERGRGSVIQKKVFSAFGSRQILDAVMAHRDNSSPYTDGFGVIISHRLQ